MAGPAKPLAGELPPKHLTRRCDQFTLMLRPPIETEQGKRDGCGETGGLTTTRTELNQAAKLSEAAEPRHQSAVSVDMSRC